MVLGIFRFPIQLRNAMLIFPIFDQANWEVDLYCCNLMDDYTQYLRSRWITHEIDDKWRSLKLFNEAYNALTLIVDWKEYCPLLD